MIKSRVWRDVWDQLKPGDVIYCVHRYVNSEPISLNAWIVIFGNKIISLTTGQTMFPSEFAQWNETLDESFHFASSHNIDWSKFPDLII